jgi:hypothetical protein
MAKRPTEPTGSDFTPIEVTPVQDNPDVQTSWTPIEVTPYTPPAAPVVEHPEPATGDTEGN